ncbi:MAG: hypothetical protein ACR2LJ_05445 [Acidimicrobiales bacterium]
MEHLGSRPQWEPAAGACGEAGARIDLHGTALGTSDMDNILMVLDNIRWRTTGSRVPVTPSTASCRLPGYESTILAAFGNIFARNESSNKARSGTDGGGAKNTIVDNVVNDNEA